MKILILVLSFNKHPYDKLMRSQQETWGCVPEPDISSLFYYGGSEQSIHHKVIFQAHKSATHELQVPFTDEYYYMAGKFSHALNHIREWDYDIMFRTNSSSYVNKKLLKEYAKNLPLEKLYAGWTFNDSNHDNGLCVSGAGIFLSKDCVELLRDEIDTTHEIEEDVYIGRILRGHGITAIDNRDRIDYPQQAWKNYKNTYHVRFKTEDRIVDSINMVSVHREIKL